MSSNKISRRLLRALPTLAVLALVPVATGCDDPLAGLFDPVIVSDTVELAAPTAPESDLPTALDVTVAGGTIGGMIGGGRRPEIPTDPINWDLLIREDGGVLYFVPPAAVDFDSRAAVTEPITDRTLDEIEEAPGFDGFATRTEEGSTTPIPMRVPIQAGARYVVRSRTTPACGSPQFSKMEVLELDVAAQTVRLLVVTNARCNDRRLVPVD